MEYKVRYEDSTGEDSVQIFATKGEAEAAIEEQLAEVKEYFKGREYDYGEFAKEKGLATEIWACNDDDYASWTKLWTIAENDMAAAKALWQELEDVPMNPETECIESDFYAFPAGTFREDIWHWIEESFNVKVHDLMYGQ